MDKKTTASEIQSIIAKTFLQYLESSLLRGFVNKLNHAFSYASNFEIISQSDYGFCYKNYSFNLNQVFRNNYDFCDFDFGRNSNFGKNNFGNCNFGLDFGNEIYDGKNNLAGFLFNRKNHFKKIFNQGEER